MEQNSKILSFDLAGMFFKVNRALTCGVSCLPNGGLTSLMV